MRHISRRAVIGACGASLAFGAGCLGDTADPDETEPNQATGNNSWTSFRAGPSNTGFVDTAIPKTEPTERWTADLALGPKTAAIMDGTAYLAAGSTLHAIGLESGEPRWTVDLENDRTAAPAVTDDAVVCPTGSGLVVVTRDGEDRRRIGFEGDVSSLRWTTQQQVQSKPSSPTVADGTAYVGTSNGDLIAVALDEDGVTWQSSATVGWTTLSQARQSGAVVSSPAVAGGRVIVGTEAGIAAFDATSGSSEWTHETDRAVRSAPAVVDGMVYVGGTKPFALEANSGDLEWQAEDAFTAMADRRSNRWTGARQLQQRVAMEPSVAVADELVVVHEPDERLVALERSDGSTRWETPLERIEPMAVQYAPSWSSPAIAGDVVVVGTSQGLVAASLTDGEGLWRVSTESRVVASPAVADGTVVVGDSSGMVYALAET